MWTRSVTLDFDCPTCGCERRFHARRIDRDGHVWLTWSTLGLWWLPALILEDYLRSRQWRCLACNTSVNADSVRRALRVAPKPPVPPEVADLAAFRALRELCYERESEELRTGSP